MRAIPFKLALLAMFLFLVAPGQAQNFIYLTKKHSNKSHHIKMYDLLTIKTTDEEVVKGTVSLIAGDELFLDGTSIPFDKIVWIKTNNYFLKGMGRSLQYGSLFFTGIFLANGLIQDNSPLLSDGNLIFIGSMLVVGVVLELLSRRKYDMEKGWKLKAIMMPTE